MLAVRRIDSPRSRAMFVSQRPNVWDSTSVALQETPDASAEQVPEKTENLRNYLNELF